MKPNETLKVINFTESPAYTKRIAGNDDDKCKTKTLRNLVLWPLVAACPVRVQHDDAPFKSEYIIPQTLLQWITKHDDYDGIVYFSNHVSSENGNPLYISNFALPASEVPTDGSGFSAKLKSKLEMTAPVSWQLVAATGPPSGLGQPIPKLKYEFIEGHPMEDNGTQFSMVEKAVRDMANKPAQI